MSREDPGLGPQLCTALDLSVSVVVPTEFTMDCQLSFSVLFDSTFLLEGPRSLTLAQDQMLWRHTELTCGNSGVQQSFSAGSSDSGSATAAADANAE